MDFEQRPVLGLPQSLPVRRESVAQDRQSFVVLGRFPMGCNHFANGLCVLLAPRLRPGSAGTSHGVLNTGESPFPRGRLGGIRPISVNCRQQPYGEDQTSRGEFVMDRCGGPMRRPRRAACLAPDLSLSTFHGCWPFPSRELLPVPGTHTLCRLSIRNGAPMPSSILRPPPPNCQARIPGNSQNTYRCVCSLRLRINSVLQAVGRRSM